MSGLPAATVGGFEEVERSLTKSIALDDTDPSASFYLALCQLKLGKHREGLARLAALDGSSLSHDRLRYHIAIGQLMNGEPGESILRELLGNAGCAGDYQRYAAWALANCELAKSNTEDAMNLLMGSV
jgi:hypothetical protein